MISMRSLGFNGRMGNQLFQYSFLRSYAEKYGFSYATPESWIGRKWFPECRNDFIITQKYPQAIETMFAFGSDNIDIWGYYQNQTSLDIANKSTVKKWFTFDESYTSLFRKPREFYIAVHIRRGDYAHHLIYPTIAKECYIEEVERLGFNKDDIVWVEEGSTTEGNTHKLEDPLYDFMTLQNADVIFRCNSTFSWWAAALSDTKEIFSPIVNDHLGEKNTYLPFVRGNHPVPTTYGPNHTDLYW